MYIHRRHDSYIYIGDMIHVIPVICTYIYIPYAYMYIYICVIPVAPRGVEVRHAVILPKHWHLYIYVYTHTHTHIYI